MRAWQRLLGFHRSGRGRAAGPLRVWLWWERFTTRRWRLRTLRPGALIWYAIRLYHGPPVTLADGTVIRDGDRIAELHLNNAGLAWLVREAGRRHWDVLRAVHADLDRLVGAAGAGALGDVKALHGITLYARVARWLGFEVRPLPRTWRWGLVRFFMAGLAVIYGPEGAHAQRVSRGAGAPWPGEVWLGQESLRRRATHPGA
ncbi:MAG: hypothetical protein K6U07_07865 [Firmicutes bacterium]|nr:hypothetical protein [Bacillota bacterium]